MNSHVYANQFIQIRHMKGIFYQVYIPGIKPYILDKKTLHWLCLAKDGILVDKLEKEICKTETLTYAKEVFARLTQQGLLLKDKPKYNWPTNHFGSSQIDSNEIQAITNIMKTKKLYRYENFTLESFDVIDGSPCEKLENKLKEYIGMKYCYVVNSGTSALECAFRVLNLQKDDEVICPIFSYVGSSASMMHIGAKPVLCDIDDTFMLDPNKIIEKINYKTKAILCPHMQGKPARIHKIAQIAKENNLYLIEDCAQSFGASYDGKILGSFGDISCFSFHQHKLITSGEGGAILCNDLILYEKIILYSDSSQLFKYPKYLPGFPAHNMRMSELHAAILLEQVKKIDVFSAHLRKIYLVMKDKLCNIDQFRIQRVTDDMGSIPMSMYLVFTNYEEGKKFLDFMQNIGIYAKFLYSPENFNNSVYLYWPYVCEICKDLSEFDTTKVILSKTISIPLSLQLNINTVESVCDDIKNYFQ